MQDEEFAQKRVDLINETVEVGIKFLMKIAIENDLELIEIHSILTAISACTIVNILTRACDCKTKDIPKEKAKLAVDKVAEDSLMILNDIISGKNKYGSHTVIEIKKGG